MTRTAIGLGISFLVALVAAAADRTVLFLERVNEFKREAHQARQKLGLDRRSLYKKYPTPELTLQPNRRVTVTPGQTVTVRARGRIPKGSLVLFDCDELDVLSLRQTTSSVDARVRVQPFSQPRLCRLHAYTPVTVANATVIALETGAKYVWKLDLSNGMRATLTITATLERGQSHSVWHDGSRLLGERAVQTGLPQPGEVRMKIVRTEEDIAASEAAWKADPAAAEMEKLWIEHAKLRNAARKECGRLPEASQKACFDRFEPQMKAVYAAGMPRLQQRQAEIMRLHPAACDELVLNLAEDGKVTGKGYGCVKTPVVDVSGTLSVIRP